MIPGWQMEGYELLRTEIVKSAVNDYLKALKKTDRIGEVCSEQLTLEEWFLSQWGQLLCGDNGELIMERCRKNYKGVTLRENPYTSEETQKRIYRDYRNGVGHNAILQMYKISSNTLYKIVKRWEK